jgi:Na+-translocating ferredoxin:NAD+ oxidoreductase RnfG subunit
MPTDYEGADVPQELNEFRAGPFSVGDLIAIAGVLLTAGAMYANLTVVIKEQDRQAIRLQALEQVVPSNYVQKAEYREDLRDVKTSLSRIESKLDTKADK